MQDDQFPMVDEAADRSPAAGSPPLVEVVIVDARCDPYGDFVEAAQSAEIGLHFCADGRSAVRLARRFRADAWIIASELPDMSGFDLLELLLPSVLQSDVDPLLSGARRSLDRVDAGGHAGVFVAADAYRIEDEQRALAAGVAGYLVRPITLDVIHAAVQRAAAGVRHRVAGPCSAPQASPDSTPISAPETSTTRSST